MVLDAKKDDRINNKQPNQKFHQRFDLQIDVGRRPPYPLRNFARLRPVETAATKTGHHLLGLHVVVGQGGVAGVFFFVVSVVVSARPGAAATPIPEQQFVAQFQQVDKAAPLAGRAAYFVRRGGQVQAFQSFVQFAQFVSNNCSFDDFVDFGDPKFHRQTQSSAAFIDETLALGDGFV
uniref:Uncharacterized protein n=1 Tax=Romanomermis culicivorax TaxID=13658 RepID=A0A915IZH9_ROMCU